MKENQVSPLNETGEKDETELDDKQETQHERRQKIEHIYKRHYQVQEFRSMLQKTSDESYNDKSFKKTLKGICAACNPLNITHLPHFLSTKVHNLKDTMEKLGFFCATASFHYFYYAVILLMGVVFLIAGQNLRDAILMSRLFKEGFPMKLVITSTVQTVFCVLTTIAGLCVVRKKTVCALGIYVMFIILSIVMILSYMTTRYYYAKEKIVKWHVERHITTAKYDNSSIKVGTFMKVIQKQLECCGSKGPSDYAVNDGAEIMRLPLSCCSHAYSTLSKADKKICYLIEKDHHIKTRRDKLMRKIVNSKGCSAKILKTLRNRNKYELILTILLLGVFILVILCTWYFWKHLRIVLYEQDIRKKLNHHKTEKKFWGHIGSRLLGKESINTTALNLLRKGIHDCNDKDEIRDFLSKCVDAKELLIQKKPMDLAEDIITDNVIPGLKTSITHVNVTKSEEYEAKFAGSGCASVTDLQVKENQDKALEKCRANVQTLLHEDYWIEEKGAKRRKVSKVPSLESKESVPSAEAVNENLPGAPFPSPLSIHQHQPIHRKSIIQLQLHKHLVKEQRLILAKLLGEFQEEQLQMENRKVKYAMSHKDVPIDEIMELNLEKENISSPHQKYSVEDIFLNKKATKTLLGPSIVVVGKDQINEEMSTLFPKVDGTESQCGIPIILKRGETFTRIPAPKTHVKKKDVSTLVHVDDLREMQPFGTQTVNPRNLENK